MKASYNWIRALVPELTCSPEELATRLIAGGLAVDAMDVYGAGIAPCVIAKVVSIRPHPTKSGLRLVTVDAGARAQEIVCGAPNVPDPGGLVVLAPLGTHLKAKGMTIETRTIAGVVSEGMLCSEQELGLVEAGAVDHGIIVLPEGTGAPGTRFIDAVPSAQDTIFELDLTPNRPDALGHLGIARDAAALYGISWKPPALRTPAKEAPGDVARMVNISIEDGERCPHYGASAVVDVTIGPSPMHVRYRLAALGVRPISNVVDVTNLVMLLYGHPMHAFDLDHVGGATIVVRRARLGEALKTLDGVDRTLSDDDLVICDGKGPVALAGVMGGAHSEISPTTKRILLECAYFEPRGVRRASRRHGLHTESSHRFERGVDHGDTAHALAEAAALVTELAGGAAVKQSSVVVKKALTRPTIRLRSNRLDQLLGVHVPFGEANDVLVRLGFEVKGDGSEFQAVVPSHRPDVSREVDLIDEVLRVRGIDSVPTVLPAIRRSTVESVREVLLQRTRAAAVELGLSEALLYGFVSPRALAMTKMPASSVTLKNPLSEHQSVMRTSLLPGLGEAVARAVRHGERDVRLFGVGPIFLPGKTAKNLPEERLAFAAILAGERGAYLTRQEPVDVWDAKGVAGGMLTRLVRRDAVVRRFDSSERPAYLHPRGAAFVEVEGRRVGTLGPLHPEVTDALDLPSETVVIFLDLATIAEVAVKAPTYAAIAKFPASTRDVALVVKNDVLAGDVERAVCEAAGELAEDVRLFDRFIGGSIPPDHASLAFHVVYRSRERTLTDAEVDALNAKVIAEVRSRFGATLRA